MTARQPRRGTWRVPLSRRSLLVRSAGALAGATALGACARTTGTPAEAAESPAASSQPASEGWYMPAEDRPDTRTWMAWPARRDVWGRALPSVRSDIAAIARAIAGYEPVSLVARPDQAAAARSACGSHVEVVELANDDLWMRDMGPVFVVDGEGGLAGLDLNFNGWGRRQVHANDAKVARKVLELVGVQRFVAPFVTEGGAPEVDGEGTALLTESSIVEENRNPGKTRAELTAELHAALGVEKVLWVPGVRGQDITDDHVDSLARFVSPGTVVVDQPADRRATDVWATSEKEALRLLRRATDARGRSLRCLVSRESATIPPGEDPELFVNVYVNWYACNGAVLIPAFGDRAADAAARGLVADLYPGRDVVQLRIDALGGGGGGIHCATQQQPVP